MIDFVHKSVLLTETINGLNIKPDGIYLDGTAGGGGHSAAIAEKLTTGRLISLDQDPDAIEVLRQRFKDNPRVTVYQSNFSKITDVLKDLQIEALDGVMMDLGVSSYQLDTAERGFSYHKEAPLDMRMKKSGATAADLVNTLSFSELMRILTVYGDEKFAKSIARMIEQERQKAPITTTTQLAEIVKNAYPAKARRDGHPARKTFQALRIAVNGEMDSLSEGLDAAFNALKPKGRLAVITFHSLEDRTVKLRMREWCEGCTCPRDFPVCVCGKKPRAVLVNRKAIEPSAEELAENNRSRSARLRVCEKTNFVPYNINREREE